MNKIFTRPLDFLEGGQIEEGPNPMLIVIITLVIVILLLSSCSCSSFMFKKQFCGFMQDFLCKTS